MISLQKIFPVALVLWLLAGCNASKDISLDAGTANHAVQFSARQLNNTIAEFGDSVLYPRNTIENGKWKTVPPRDWTSGFFPGCLWYMSSLQNDSVLRNTAERWTAGLTDQQYLTQTHDIGFIIFDSFGKGYQLGGKTEYKPILLQAARSLMTRYNPTVGCIKSWDKKKWGFPVIIDNMMNLELLFWASKNGGTKDMFDAAVSHAGKTMANHFRPDGSTYHVVNYDTVSGNVLSQETHQGFANESVWARGQAWAVYGFTMAYRESQHPEFLATAEKAAVWFIDNLPADHVPYWDFRTPNIPNEKKDASAAAIAASALFELSGLTDKPELKTKFAASAKKILAALCSKEYLAEGTTSHGILNHAVGNYPANSEIDVSLIYGDYYFLEALYRFNQLGKVPNNSNSTN